MGTQEVNQSLRNSSNRFTAAANKFLDSLTLIEALAQISNPNIHVVSANKKRLAQSVINRTMEMASALAQYAAQLGDLILSSKVSMSPDMIARSWDPVISATARSIYDLAGEMIATGGKQAELCGITMQKNQLLLNSIVAFSAAIGSENASRSHQPVSLEAEFLRADEVLKAGIDPLVAAFKAQRETFLAGYRQARELAESLPVMMNI